MTDTLVLFLPTADTGWWWLRIADAQVRERGEGLPTLVADDETPPPTVVAPADSVTLHWAELPEASPAQALTAARLLVGEASAATPAALHVAVGRETGRSDRPIGVVAAETMRGWLEMLADGGLDPAAVIPSPMLLPPPEAGFVSGDIGGERLVRGVTTAFADEEPLTGLITEGVEPETIAEERLEAAIVAAIAAPPLDLRQGAFARRRKLTVDWALVRRLAWLGVAIVVVTFLLGVVRIYRLNADAGTLEQRADALARAALARGEAVNDADRQLDARLAGLRGAGRGFTATSAAVFAAVRAVPGTELTSLAFDADGTLHAHVTAETEGQATQLVGVLRGNGFDVTPSTFTAAGGRVAGDLTVKAP